MSTVLKLRPRPATRPSAAGADAALLRSTYAFVLAGGRGTRLLSLTEGCAKPAMPFGGEHRIIDFTLSNCLNSGVQRIGVLTQYRAQGLIRHLSAAWGFLDAARGECLEVVPALQAGAEGGYRGTADAVAQNLALVREAGADHVLVLAGDHVYRMDYGGMLAEHVQHGADLTVACNEVPLAEASAFGVMAVDAEGRITAFAEKPVTPWPVPDAPGHALASMGIYAFDTAFLERVLAADAADPESSHDFGRDVIPRALRGARVHAHRFTDSCVRRPYWRDVGTLDGYWRANLDLTAAEPELDLHDGAWPLRARLPRQAPAQFIRVDDQRPGIATDSLVSGGCVIRGGTVRRSVLCSDVRVAEGARVDGTLLLPEARVGARAVVRRAVIGPRCVLPDGIRIGICPEEDRARFQVSPGGVVLVTAEMLARRVPGYG